MRSLTRLAAVVSLFVVGPAWTCAAQGVGIGGRLSMVRGDVQADTSAERFTGGHLRAWLSKRTALEVSFDRRVQNNDTLTEQYATIRCRHPSCSRRCRQPLRRTFSAEWAGTRTRWNNSRVSN